MRHYATTTLTAVLLWIGCTGSDVPDPTYAQDMGAMGDTSADGMIWAGPYKNHGPPSFFGRSELCRGSGGRTGPNGASRGHGGARRGAHPAS